MALEPSKEPSCRQSMEKEEESLRCKGGLVDIRESEMVLQFEETDGGFAYWTTA